MASFNCGHCGVLTAANSLTKFDPTIYPGVGKVAWFVLQCAACGSYSLVADGSEKTLYFPPEGHLRVSNVDKVPGLIKADYEEALAALIGGQYKAATVMARRAVQGVCRDLGADPDDKLFKQIEFLAEKGELTVRLAKLAHNVRGLGNDGAHPRDDGIDEVTTDDAKLALGFVEHLLQHVYIIDAPEEVKASE